MYFVKKNCILSNIFAVHGLKKAKKSLVFLIICIDLFLQVPKKIKIMKSKPTLLSVIFSLIISFSFAQEEKVTVVTKKKKAPITMISGKVYITKYHSYEELNKLTKGELLSLYSERIEVIVNILPSIAFATKPDVTMESLGIPETKENKKALEASREASIEYFDSTVEFQRKILPYSDTRDLIAAILFYEETLKSLHTYNDFKVD